MKIYLDSKRLPKEDKNNQLQQKQMRNKITLGIVLLLIAGFLGFGFLMKKKSTKTNVE